jgi:hypothetical protein
MASFLLAAALQAPPVEATPAPPRPVADEELPEWLAVTRPVLRSVEIVGLEHTREALVRRELRLEENAVLDRDRLQAMRLRLEETRVFETIDFHVFEAGQGHATLEVALDERHGFGNLWNLAGRGVVDALRKKARLRYSNIAGRGVNLLAEHKWERTQPSWLFAAHAVRPLGLPANLEVVARGARPQYDLEDDATDPFTLRTRGVEAIARRVVAKGTVLELGARVRDRTFTVDRPETRDGVVAGPQWAIEHGLWDTPRHRAIASLRVFHAVPALGSDLEYTKGVVGLSYRWWPGGRGRDLLPPSEVAGQVQWGRGSAETPLDDMFAPGAASEMEFPLRAHRQKRNGILGRAPIGRDLVSANLEWRQCFLTLDTFKAGAVVFYDVAHTGRSPQGSNPTLHDVGVGLRLQTKGHSILRVDFARGLSDGKNALTAGIGHAF